LDVLRIVVLINVREVIAFLEGIIDGSGTISVPLFDLAFCQGNSKPFPGGGGKTIQELNPNGNR
jgi:hypothetical protein